MTQNINIPELSTQVKKKLSNKCTQGGRVTTYKQNETRGWNICQPLGLIYYSPETAPVSVEGYLHIFAKIHLARFLTFWVAWLYYPREQLSWDDFQADVTGFVSLAAHIKYWFWKSFILIYMIW